MRFSKLMQKNREASPKSWELVYSKKIEKKIREKYSLNAELAILRQRDTKQDEFAEYFEYVEKCKALVKEELGIV